MKGVKGTSFGVRFYRRGGTKTGVKNTGMAEIANAVEDIDALEQAMSNRKTMEERTTMTDIPPQTFTYKMKRDADASVKATNPQKIEPAPRAPILEQMLFAAARAGDCGRIRKLVMEGVDLDARDTMGRTAINIATQYNQQNALKTLLAAREMRRMAKLGELPQTKFYKKFDQKKSESA